MARAPLGFLILVLSLGSLVELALLFGTKSGDRSLASCNTVEVEGRSRIRCQTFSNHRLGGQADQALVNLRKSYNPQTNMYGLGREEPVADELYEGYDEEYLNPYKAPSMENRFGSVGEVRQMQTYRNPEKPWETQVDQLADDLRMIDATNLERKAQGQELVDPVRVQKNRTHRAVHNYFIPGLKWGAQAPTRIWNFFHDRRASRGR